MGDIIPLYPTNPTDSSEEPAVRPNSRPSAARRAGAALVLGAAGLAVAALGVNAWDHEAKQMGPPTTEPTETTIDHNAPYAGMPGVEMGGQTEETYRDGE